VRLQAGPVPLLGSSGRRGTRYFKMMPVTPIDKPFRHWGGNPVRKTSVSDDGGQTWSTVEDEPELRDPSCMAPVLRYTDPADGGKSRILFSGPQSGKRENGAVFISYDEGKTWPLHRVLTKEAFAYSCLAALPDGEIGCLYEANGRIVFARFTLDWLTEGKDSLEMK
jgi:sialidase-1